MGDLIGCTERTLGNFALATTEALAPVLRLSAVSYPCGSFSELETVALSDTTPCEALAVYRDFSADRHTRLRAIEEIR
jgi:hypothetical protein